MKRISILAVVFAVAMANVACTKANRYTVISRTNPDDSFVAQVPVVLEHNGTRYYAQCNNIKAVQGSKETAHCNLHVGMVVECQFFNGRDVSGYDLICGSKRNDKGNLDTYGENELLLVDKEVSK